MLKPRVGVYPHQYRRSSHWCLTPPDQEVSCIRTWLSTLQFLHMILRYVETKYKLTIGPAQSTQLAKAITTGAEKGVFALPKGMLWSSIFLFRLYID